MSDVLLITGGLVITPEGIHAHDILIRDGLIQAVGDSVRDSAPTDAGRVDASGLHILPGLLDMHTHMREPGGAHKEDFTTGTAAALAGGVTAIGAMPNTAPSITDQQTLDAALALAAEKAVCDYGVYIGATAENAAQAAEVREALALKMFMGSSTGTLLVKDVAGQIPHFEAYPRDRVLAVHAEDEDAVQYYGERGRRRPPVCALLGVSRALALAEATGRKLHILHVTTGAELELIATAKARGVRVTCETCPQYLFLTTDDVTRLGAFALCNPPIREPGEPERLWERFAVIDMIATDHAPHLAAEKRGPNPPGGLPGVQTSLPLMLTAVAAGRLMLTDLARLMAEAPARIYGLRRKGRIAPGFDADLTLIDPAERWTIRDEDMLSKAGWTPYHGFEATGRVKGVYLRGQHAYNGAQVLLQPGAGRPLEVTPIPNPSPLSRGREQSRAIGVFG
ncbi:MAG: dihydroorotase family protein [Anaerolineae bacterium]|nr:dihydroorotase family protein [Anaerolineae bacterium]